MAEIEEEERKRSEVKEKSVPHPSHRANLSLSPHPGKSLFPVPTNVILNTFMIDTFEKKTYRVIHLLVDWVGLT